MAGNKFLEVIRQAAKDTNRMATDMTYGKVTSLNPLTVTIDNRLPLTDPFVVTTSMVSDFDVDMEIDGQTRSCRIKLGLKVGENVLLLRTQNGQRYIIIDRIR
jgi:hypothetical protein